MNSLLHRSTCTRAVSPGSSAPLLGHTRYVLLAVVLICTHRAAAYMSRLPKPTQGPSPHPAQAHVLPMEEPGPPMRETIGVSTSNDPQQYGRGHTSQVTTRQPDLIGYHQTRAHTCA